MSSLHEALVRRTGRGAVLTDEAELQASFRGAEAEAAVRSLAC